MVSHSSRSKFSLHPECHLICWVPSDFLPAFESQILALFCSFGFPWHNLEIRTSGLKFYLRVSMPTLWFSLNLTKCRWWKRKHRWKQTFILSLWSYLTSENGAAFWNLILTAVDHIDLAHSLCLCWVGPQYRIWSTMCVRLGFRV